jgi:hypothetical protein
VATKFPFDVEIDSKSGKLDEFDKQFFFVQLGKRDAERDEADACERCEKGFTGKFDKTPAGKKPVAKGKAPVKGTSAGTDAKDGKDAGKPAGGKRMLAGKSPSGGKDGDGSADRGGTDDRSGSDDRAGTDAPNSGGSDDRGSSDDRAGTDAPDREGNDDSRVGAGTDAPKSPGTSSKAKPSAKKGPPVKMTADERVKLKEEMFKPKITMQKSRKLCNRVEVNDPDKKIPFVRGKFIGCVELTKKSTKQAIRVCDKSNVVEVEPKDKPEDVLATISADDVKVGGNEKDPVARKDAINKGTDALTVLKAMRDPPKNQNADEDEPADKSKDDKSMDDKSKDDKSGANTSNDEPADKNRNLKEDAKAGTDSKDKNDGGDASRDGGDAKAGTDAKDKDGADAKGTEQKKKNVPEKAGDKRKKGSPMNQSRIMCNAKCSGNCEQRGLRKTSCICGEGQNGKWCNTKKAVREKKTEYCAKFTEGQQDAHCADWDVDTQKDMLKYYRVGIRLCSMDRPNMVKNMKQAVATLAKIMDGDSPFSNKRLQRVISSFVKGAKENKWEIADKVKIQNQINNLYPQLKPERGMKEEVEEEESQLAKRTDDGGEQALSGEFLP